MYYLYTQECAAARTETLRSVRQIFLFHHAATTASFPNLFPAPGVDLQPLPESIPVTRLAAIRSPLLYYLAFTPAPPIPHIFIQDHPSPISVTRCLLAFLSYVLFFTLPLHYHVPFSIGLIYQIALVALYNGYRILNVSFISRHLLAHIPRRRHSPQ